MRFTNPFSDFAIGRWLDTLLPDFVLAFAFFTALVYAVLGKRFEHHRSAVAASAAMGMALSVGLIWWEQEAGLSIRNLGSVAVGFAIIILAGVMYQAIRQTGGSWAGAGLALGGSLIVAWMLGTKWPVREQIVQTVMAVALIGGVVAFLAHRSHQGGGRSAPVRSPINKAIQEVPFIRRNVQESKQGRAVSEVIRRNLKDARRKVDHLHEHPEKAGDALVQIRRMLPAEGWLTERLAQLRENAHRFKEGHVARIEELQQAIGKLPSGEKRKVAEQLVASYKELRLDVRLERLDQAVAANEKTIRELTQQAEGYAASHDYRRLHDALKAAQKLQGHNSALFKTIDRTEKHLQALATRISKQAGGEQ
jgi:hypothetical protein